MHTQTPSTRHTTAPSSMPPDLPSSVDASRGRSVALYCSVLRRAYSSRSPVDTTRTHPGLNAFSTPCQWRGEKETHTGANFQFVSFASLFSPIAYITIERLPALCLFATDAISENDHPVPSSLGVSQKEEGWMERPRVATESEGSHGLTGCL
jgi:hypothetical protein